MRPGQSKLLRFIAVMVSVPLVITSIGCDGTADLHPDHDMIVRQLQVVAAQASGSTNTVQLDLANLNDGEWHTACLFGGYTFPSRTIEGLGVEMSSEDLGRLAALRDRLGGVSEVEEFEPMVVYVAQDNQAHLIHTEQGFGSRGQHFERCITKPQTAIPL